MSLPLRFEDHAAFHRQVVRLTLVGAALGLGAHLVGLLGVTGEGAVLRLVALAASAALLGLAALPPRRAELLRALPVAALAGFLGAMSLHLLSGAPPAYPWFGLGLYGLSVGFLASRDLKGPRRWLVPLATGCSTALATWATVTLETRLPLTAYVPALFAAPMHGAVYGFLVAMGLVVRQLRLDRDPVALAFLEMRPSLSGEMLELCERAMGIHRRITEEVRQRKDQGTSTEPKLVAQVEKLVLKILALGRRWQEVERQAGSTTAEALADRLGDLRQKVSASQDPVARRQYQKAQDALEAQLGYLREISRSRERVMARVHNYLAALERLHLAVLNHRGADAAKFSDELQPIMDEMDDLGAEMDIAAETMSEVAEAQLPKEQAVAPTPAAATTETAEPQTAAPESAAPATAAPEAVVLEGPVPRPVDPEAELTAAAFK